MSNEPRKPGRPFSGRARKQSFSFTLSQDIVRILRESARDYGQGSMSAYLEELIEKDQQSRIELKINNGEAITEND